MSQLLAGLPATSYYAPRARIEIENRELTAEALADVMSVSVSLDADSRALASFSLTINNWDAARLAFKYSNTELFDVGRSVHVQLGYADRVVSMVRGIITSLSPKFPEAGASTLSVSGQDGLVLLRDRKPKANEQRKFAGQTDGQIAEVIAKRNNLTPVVDLDGEPHPQVFQRDLDDLQFLIERAKRSDFDCYIANDPEGGKDQLHFKRPSDGRDAQTIRIYTLAWGKNLITFTPQITIARQVASVEVRGWDPMTKQVIVGKATLDDLPGKAGKGTSGPQLTKDRLRDKQDTVVQAPVHSTREANDLAKALLRRRAYDFVTGSGQCIGQPEMRPGDNIRLSGLGVRYDGDYYITRTTHTFSGAGYLTDFEVRRIYDGGLA